MTTVYTYREPDTYPIPYIDEFCKDDTSIDVMQYVINNPEKWEIDDLEYIILQALDWISTLSSGYVDTPSESEVANLPIGFCDFYNNPKETKTYASILRTDNYLAINICVPIG